MPGSDFLFAKALWAALLLGLFCPVIGRHLVMSRAILMGLAVPQVATAGVAFVFLASGLGWRWAVGLETDAMKAFSGALLFTVPALCVPVLLRGKSDEPAETSLAVIYLAAVSSAHLMLSSDAVGEMYLEDLFHGRMLLLSDAALTMLGIGLCIAAGMATLLRRRILLALSDPAFAAANRLPVVSWNMAAALLNGCAIGVAVAAVGPLVTFGLLIVPVLAATLFATSLRLHLLWSMGFGVVMAVTGCLLSFRYDLPMGDSVVATACAMLLLTRAVTLKSGRSFAR
jgi:zinc transport system permease protein